MNKLKENNTELDLEASPLPTVQDGISGASQYTSEIKKELEDCGYKNIAITTLYPRRRESEWYEGLRIVEFEYKGLTFRASCGGNGVCLNIQDVNGNEETVYSMEDLEEYGVVDDETFYQFIHDQEDVLDNEDMFEENDCIMYWDIFDDNGNNVGTSWDFNANDSYNLNTLFEQLTDRRLLDSIIQELIDDGRLDNDDESDVEEIQEDIDDEDSDEAELEIDADEAPFTIDKRFGCLSINDNNLKREVMSIVAKDDFNYTLHFIDYDAPIRIWKDSNPVGGFWFFIQAYVPNIHRWQSFRIRRDKFHEILNKLNIEDDKELHSLFEELDVDVRQNKVIDIKDLPQDCKQYIIDNFCGEHPTPYLTKNFDKTWSLYPLTDWGSDKPTKYQISVKSKNPGYGQPIIEDIQFEEMCNACGYKVPVIEELDIESSKENEYSFIQGVIDTYSNYLSDFSRDEIIDLYLEHGDDDDRWMMSITNNEEETYDDYFGDFRTVLDRFERYLGNNGLDDNDELEFRYYDKENDAWYDIFYMVYHNGDEEISEDLDLDASETNGLPLQTKRLYKGEHTLHKYYIIDHDLCMDIFNRSWVEENDNGYIYYYGKNGCQYALLCDDTTWINADKYTDELSHYMDLEELKPQHTNEELDLEPESQPLPEPGKTINQEDQGSDYGFYEMSVEQCELLDSITPGEKYDFPSNGNMHGEMFRRGNNIWVDFFDDNEGWEIGSIDDLTQDDLDRLGITLEEIPDIDKQEIVEELDIDVNNAKLDFDNLSIEAKDYILNNLISDSVRSIYSTYIANKDRSTWRLTRDHLEDMRRPWEVRMKGILPLFTIYLTDEQVEELNDACGTLDEGFITKDGKDVGDVTLKKVGNSKLSLYVDRRLAAWVYVSDTGYIYYLETKKDMRGLGLGSILMDKAINELGGYWLHIEKPNIRVQKWYESLGFVLYNPDDKYVRLMVLKDRIDDFENLYKSCKGDLRKMLGNLNRAFRDLVDYEENPEVRTQYDDKGNILKEPNEKEE